MKRKNKRPAAPARAKAAARKTAKPRGQPAPANQARAKSSAKSSREKVSAHRARLRYRGFRLIQMWLPDTRSPEFAAQAHKDSLAIAQSATEAEDQAFIDSVSWWNSPEAAALQKSEPPTPWWRTSGRSD